MKILHSADLHLDTPFTGRTPEQAQLLREELLKIPDRIADLCCSRGCDLVLLAGDVFDGACSRESCSRLYSALERMKVPVFISPGNHDFCGLNSPWIQEKWPKNVYIFRYPVLEGVTVPELDCRVYGAGYQAMDCPGLLEGFLAEGTERYHIGILHADPTRQGTSYCPMTAEQIRESGLDYLALGHVHKSGLFWAGETLCAWPGCPMGRGYDETGVKGVLVTELTDGVQTEFVPLPAPAFYDLEAESADAAARLLPPGGSNDFYRITLTGYAGSAEPEKIRTLYAQFPHLELIDKTVSQTDLWQTADEDSLEGIFFRSLRQQAGDPEVIRLAAWISRQILDGQEVRLP